MTVVTGIDPVPPREALEYFRSKGLAAEDRRFDYRDVWTSEHARSFVVAKGMRDEVLTTIRGHLDRALAEGTPRQRVLMEMEADLRRLGWWGKQSVTDPLTGETREVQLGSRARLETIFTNNMRAAYQAGRWAQIQRVKDELPFLQYVQVQRDSKREEHAKWHLMVLPVDHPAWRQIYPPNGYNCLCGTRQLDQRMMDRRGLTVTEDPQLDEREVLNPRTGEIDLVPDGVHPAWNSNGGAEWMDLRARHDRVSADLGPEARASEYGLIAETRNRGLRDGEESLSALELDTGRPLDWARGHESGVDPTRAMIEAARAGTRLGLIHNHPRSSPFSGQDLIAVGASPGVARLIAVGHDGSIYAAIRRGAGDRELIGRIQREASRLLWRDREAWGDAGPDELTYIQQAAVSLAADALGLIEYREALSPLRAQLRARVAAELARMVDEIVEVVT
jgi:hypothetical protein